MILSAKEIKLALEYSANKIKMKQHICETCINGDWQVNGAETNPDLAPLFHSECKNCSPVDDNWKPRKEN